jgi:hypothetical protein
METTAMSEDVTYDSINEAEACKHITFKKAETKHIVVDIKRVGCSCTDSQEQSRTKQSRAKQRKTIFQEP